jgi:hypothetical protein
MGDALPHQPSARSQRWASTMSGYSGPARLAHADSHARIGPPPVESGGASENRFEPLERPAREAQEDAFLAAGATRAHDGGERARP